MQRALGFTLLALLASACGGAVVDTPSERSWNRVIAQAEQAKALAADGRHAAAAKVARPALVAHDEAGRSKDDRAEALLFILARGAREQADWATVERSATRLLRDFRHTEDKTLWLRLTLGEAQVAQGRFAPALKTLDRGLTLAVHVAKRPPPSQTLVSPTFGAVAVLVLDPIEITDPGNSRAVAFALAKQGEAHLGLERPAPAVLKLEEALTIYRRIDGPVANGALACLQLLGRAHRLGGDLQASERALTGVLEGLRARAGLHTQAGARAYYELGLTAVAAQDWGAAHRHLGRAVKLGERVLDDRETLARWRTALEAASKRERDTSNPAI